jgi:glycerophosphoryl diester phosphodiesterase
MSLIQNSSRKRNKISATIALAVILVMAPFAKPVIRKLDLEFFHEQLKDAVGRLTSNEDWNKVVPLRSNTDTRWLAQAKSSGSLIYIAHALGGSGTATGNTLPAFEAARAKGYRLFEVDISLDEQGRLRCHHGPELAPSFDEKSSCTFERLLPMVDQVDGWVVVDIKTDFYKTAEKILQAAQERRMTQRLIFQLYHSDQLAWFEKMAAMTRLPTPIVTVYDSKRSANHIIQYARAIGIQALTIPTEKLDSLGYIDPAITLLTHPIHSCADWEAIRPDLKIGGIYASISVNLSTCKKRQ